jgi:hypothetical protein
MSPSRRLGHRALGESLGEDATATAASAAAIDSAKDVGLLLFTNAERLRVKRGMPAHGPRRIHRSVDAACSQGNVIAREAAAGRRGGAARAALR